MHVNLLPIAPLAAHNGRYHDELVLADEVADTSLVLAGEQVEFQGRGKLKEEEEEAEERPHGEPGSPHCQWQRVCRWDLGLSKKDTNSVADATPFLRGRIY